MINAEYVDHMGTDLSVLNAAKVSFAKRSNWENSEYGSLSKGDQSLITFLARGYKNSDWHLAIKTLTDESNEEKIEEIVTEIKKNAVHWTPFTHTAITLRCSAPVPIRTQAFKHKQGFTENEESRRYISSTPEVYTPNWRWAADNVKQGSGRELTQEEAHNLPGVHEYERVTTAAVNTYFNLINDGICPEQARFVLPQGCIVNWIWTGNLASYARFFNQRTDSHAQKESKILAESIDKIISPLFPYSWNALTYQ